MPAHLPVALVLSMASVARAQDADSTTSADTTVDIERYRSLIKRLGLRR